MTCYRPLKGFPIGFNPTGKPNYSIQSYDTNHMELRGDKWIPSNLNERSGLARKVVCEFVQIPCGKCIGCRLNYSRQWADRCMLELQEHKSSYFVTLTYDDEHLPLAEYLNEDTGAYENTGTLRKEDFQKFMKRLRKNLNQEVRYFACGEYGSWDTTHRPHFHAIIFGLELDDLVPFFKNEQGDWIYLSDTLSRIWKNGIVSVGEVTWETCAYTARYITKKLYGLESKIYDELNIVPEFTLMSRKPGIARNYYENNKDKIYSHDYISLSSKKGGLKVRPSRYFDNLLEKDDKELFDRLKKKKIFFADEQTDLMLSNTDYDYIKELEVQEKHLEKLTKSLDRKEIK